MQLRRLAVTAIAAIAATTSLAACGSSDDAPTAGATEGPYVNTGNLKYQV
jgi:outer membrane protein assembly factor BamE (lipoprotein component of BamABCDE complex)